MNVSLSPVAAEIIAEQLALGFASADEVIEEALRRMQTEAQQKLDALKAAVELGAEQAENGQFSPRSFDQMIEAARTQIASEAL